MTSFCVRLLCYLVLLMMASGLLAQNTPPSGTPPMRGAETARRFGPGFTPPPGTVSVVGRAAIMQMEKGFANTFVLLSAGRDQNVRNTLGFSEEQAETLKSLNEELRGQMLADMPKYLVRFQSMTPNDHAAMQKEIEMKMEEISNKVEKVTTPEQKQKARTLVFQGMGGLESPVINLDAMSALNLSDAQKEKMKGTFKELEAERLAQLEEGIKLAEKAMALGGPAGMSAEDRKKIEEERKALEVRIFATGKKLGEKLRVQLTSEQIELEKNLIANRPAFLPKLPGPMRVVDDATYKPSQNSWTPGQGAPERQNERTRKPFPRTEKEEVSSETLPDK
ncbi:MAG: hypothetical protein ACRCUY_09890 [Thermoguttaceae bacterium]